MTRRATFATSLCLLSAAGCSFGGGGITPIRTAFNKGVYHHSAGELDEAVAEYRLALEEDPGDYRARFNLAVALQDLADRADADGRNDDAAALRERAGAQLRQVLAAHPDNLRAAVDLAALEWRGDPAAGRARLQALIAAHPDAALPRTALAAHLLAAGEVAAAVELLEAARRLDPADVGVNLLLGDAHARLGDDAAARDAYERVLRRDQAQLGALVGLARVEQHAGDPESARAAVEQALLADPDHLPALRMAADLAEARGDLEEAVRDLWHVRALTGADDAALRARLIELYRGLLARERESAQEES